MDALTDTDGTLSFGPFELDARSRELRPALSYVAVDPRFEPIRADLRYGRLIDLLGLG